MFAYASKCNITLFKRLLLNIYSENLGLVDEKSRRISYDICVRTLTPSFNCVAASHPERSNSSPECYFFAQKKIVHLYKNEEEILKYQEF